MDGELIVRGVGEVRAMPDLASVRVGVDGEGQSREVAYQTAAKTAAAVDEVFADFETAIDRVTTAALAVQPRTRWRKGETQRSGWQALRVSVVEIKETARAEMPRSAKIALLHTCQMAARRRRLLAAFAFMVGSACFVAGVIIEIVASTGVGASLIGIRAVLACGSRFVARRLRLPAP